MASLFQGLLKTPEQVRQEQQKMLQERGLTAAAMLTQGGGGTTGLPGLLKGFGANIAQNIDTQAANLKQRGLLGLGSIAGAMGNEQAQSALSQASMSPEERQAVMQQGVIAGTDTGNIESLKRTIEKLRSAGANPALIEQLSTRMRGLQDKALERNRQALLDQANREDRSQRRALVSAQISEIERNTQDRAEQKQALNSLLPEIDSKYMSDEMKTMVQTLDPKEGLAFVKDAQAREQQAQKLAAFNKREAEILKTVGGSQGVGTGTVEQINSVYNALIRGAKQASLPGRAEQLENERKALVSNKNDIRGVEEDLRKGFRKDATLATQREVVDQARKGIKFLETGEGAADIAGIITFMKSLDPGSVVREGEFATAASVGGIVDSLGATFEGWKEGDRLTDKQRAELAKAMTVAATVASESYNNYRATELEAYNGRGYNGEYIVSEPLSVPKLGSLATVEESNAGIDDETAGSLFGSFGSVN